MFIVEDIIDLGFMLSWLLENFEFCGVELIEVFVLLCKLEVVKVEIDCKYVGFDILVEFVVGYGLDYVEWYCNLWDVVVLVFYVYS